MFRKSEAEDSDEETAEAEYKSSDSQQRKPKRQKLMARVSLCPKQSGCLEETDLENTDHRPQTLKTQTSDVENERRESVKALIAYFTVLHFLKAEEMKSCLK